MATTSQAQAQARASQSDTPMENDGAAPESRDTPADGDNNNNNNGDARTSTPQPPPPAPPIVPGPRATRFQELYAQSLKRTLAKLKWDNFAACYPTVASKAEPVLKQVQTQMAEKLAEKCEVRTLKKCGRWRRKTKRQETVLLTYPCLIFARENSKASSSRGKLCPSSTTSKASSQTPHIDAYPQRQTLLNRLRKKKNPFPFFKTRNAL